MAVFLFPNVRKRHSFRIKANASPLVGLLQKTNTMKVLLYLLPILLFTACESNPSNSLAEEAAVIEGASPFADRIANAESRLKKSDASQLILEAINAHGGLEKWYAQSPLYYRFNYQPTENDKTIRDSYILNDYVNARAIHQSADQKGMSYGFDGKEAWKLPADAELSVNSRFWSLTPYYFVGLPFVLADEGIFFEQLEDADWEGTSYHRVKVTYGEGIGDADQDYYVLWLNPETKQMDALNYIVSYSGFFPDGGHLPEKLMVLNGKTTVDGITLPTGFTTRWSDKPTEVITNITVSDYSFRPDSPADAFDKPAAAAIVE